MNITDYDPTSPEAMLYAYLDGELQPELDESLFSTLASQPALRSEMRELLAIRRGIRSEIIVPPVTMGANILAAAGLPSLVASGASAAGSATLASQFGWKAFLAIVSKPVLYTLLGSLLTLTGVSIFNNTTHTNTTSANTASALVEQQASPAVSVVTNGTANNTQNTALLYAQESPVHSTNVQTTSVPTVRYVVIADAQEEEQSTPAIQTPPSANAASEEMTISTVAMQNDKQVRNLLPLAQNQNSTTAAAFPTKDEMIVPQRENISLSNAQLRLRSLYTLGQTIQPSSNQGESLFENAAGSVLFRVADNINLGIEVGREAFAQEFEGIERGVKVAYRQAPTITWAGVHGEYMFPVQGFGGVQPYLGGTLGYAAGAYPMVRWQGGFHYAPADNVKFFVGYEGAGIGYQYQNVGFFSLKHSLTYGISVRF